MATKETESWFDCLNAVAIEMEAEKSFSVQTKPTSRFIRSSLTKLTNMRSMRTMNQNSPKPPIPHLQKLINECYEAMVEAINDECNANGSEDARSAACTVNTNDGYIDLWMDHCGNTEVIIVHDNDSEGECPLLCKAIEDGLPDWSETVEQWEEDNPYEDEWTSHGFRDEADYIHWRYG